jgi:hypothetical protein
VGGSRVSLNTVAKVIMLLLLTNEPRLFSSYPVSLPDCITLADGIFLLIQKSSKEYIMQLCTIPLDLTSRSGFTATIIYQHTKYNTSKFFPPFYALFSHVASYQEVSLPKFSAYLFHIYILNFSNTRQRTKIKFFDKFLSIN